MSAPHPWHVYESAYGDRATVRYKSEHVHFSYIGPSGVDGIHFADASGRSSLGAGDFAAIYPRHAADCARCETLVRWGQLRR